MTTALATASVDELLAFLRSTEPPPRRVTATRRPRPASPLPERRPLSPVEAATLRRPPRAATKWQAAAQAYRQQRDYGGEHRSHDRGRRLNQIECRLVAWLTCRALGDAWRFEPDPENRFHRLVHRATTATLLFRGDWRHEGRYVITPGNVYQRDTLPRSISVAATRCPADIARDIERRLIHAGLLDANAAYLTADHERRALEARRWREVLAVARAYGGNLRPERVARSNINPEGTTAEFGRRTNEYDRDAPESSIHGGCGYNGLVVTIETHNVALAVQVAELVRRHYQAGGERLQ